MKLVDSKTFGTGVISITEPAGTGRRQPSAKSVAEKPSSGRAPPSGSPTERNTDLPRAAPRGCPHRELAREGVHRGGVRRRRRRCASLLEKRWVSSAAETLCIAYSKGNRSDINRDSLWPIVAEYGMRPIGQAAVDVWSALRFRPLREGEAPFTGGR